MIRNPRDLKRYTASERANHWVVGICFILLALSGLAFFHPAFFPLTQLFGGGPWTRILHPYIGVVMMLFFIMMFLRFWRLNVMEQRDVEWLKNVKKMIDGNDHDMPEQGKYNGGQKVLFWGLVVGMLALGYLWVKTRRGCYGSHDCHALETGAAFWHMVDLLWIVLFPLVYVMR